MSALSLAWWFVALALSAGFGAALYRLKFDRISLLIALSGALTALFFLAASDWMRITSDPLAQLDYIRYLIDNRALPEPDLKPAYRHPPTYYLMVAPVFALAEGAGGQAAAIAWTQLVSFALFMVFMGYGALALRLCLPRGAGYYTALSLLFFWPLVVTLAGRVSLDLPIYACTAGLFYHLLRWQRTGEAVQLALVAAFIGMGFLFKNSMVVWLPVVALPVALSLVSRRFPWPSLLRRDVLIAGALGGTAAIYSFLRPSTTHYISSEMVGLAVARLPEQPPAFDPYVFLSYTIQHPLSTLDTPIFWNIVLRTLAFDRFLWRSEWTVLIVAVLLLALLAWLLASLPWMAWKDRAARREMGLPLWTIAALLAALGFMFHVFFNYAHYANMRYIPAAVIALTLLYGQAVSWHRARGHALMANAGMALSAAFCLASLWLLASEHVDALRLDLW